MYCILVISIKRTSLILQTAKESRPDLTKFVNLWNLCKYDKISPSLLDRVNRDNLVSGENVFGESDKSGEISPRLLA